MSTEMESLIRMARWGREQGKKNIIADLAPLCEMADQIDRLRTELVAVKADPVRQMLCWTSERPTEPGWYWIRGRVGNWAEYGVLVQVEIYPNLEPQNQVVICWGDIFPKIPPNAEWWGPVPKPE